jgi:hypothetical protein
MLSNLQKEKLLLEASMTQVINMGSVLEDYIFQITIIGDFKS